MVDTDQGNKRDWEGTRAVTIGRRCGLAVNRDILSLARQADFDELESEDIEDVLASHTEELTNKDLQQLTEHSPVEDDDEEEEPQQTLTSKRLAESLNMFQQAVQMLLDDDPNRMYATATRDAVAKKTNSLPTAFRRECKKVMASARSGAGSEDIYVPSLWYCDLLIFIKNQEMPRPSVTNVDEDPEASLLMEPETPDSSEIRPSSALSETSGFTGQLSTTTKIRKSGSSHESNGVLSLNGDILAASTPEDEWDITDKVVATKLCNLPENMQIHTEKLINDALYEARRGLLNDNSKICSNEYALPSSASCLQPSYSSQKHVLSP
ncbi:hypothetical protein Hamer_G001394 [Homarus americanus]|uniref:Uncharacterized protein n=1 Tax=Homarus americanus TaxID=6706 RepID=A0A8J5THH7_HOMAM|nr:hypothetical protein Hamer_G001394 [Homarus americanus]